ncbi:MAG: hypothetical protein IJ875_05995, partial [Solobacterium sp.]|nr:hypothetical protein [Solobacterium sp.]
KKLLAICIALLLALYITPIQAEDVPTITFTGSTGKLSSNEDMLYVNFGDVLPGDRLEQLVKIQLKDIKEDTKVYLEIDNDHVNLPKDIRFSVYVDNQLILDGINQSLSQHLICKTEKDKDIECKIVIDVPVTIGNEVKNITKDNLWTIVVEDKFGEHHIVDTGIDYGGYVRNLSLFLLSITVVLGIIAYKVVKKEGNTYN